MTSPASRVFGLLLAGLLGATSSCSRSEHKAAPPTSASASELAASAAPGAAPTAVAPGSEPAKLCQHRVPADLCTQCNPELADVFKDKGDWCNEHGVPESQCLKCNPRLDFTKAAAAQPATDWCNEHGVPESMCTKCKPALVAKFVATGDFCREHGVPESVCPVCHPEKVRAAGHEPPVFPKPGTKVKLASAETEREVGIEAERVEKRPFARSLDVVGQLHFNENRLARLSPRGEGVVLEVKVDIGDEVKRGQPLVVMASGGIGQDQSKVLSARARLQAARASLDREKALLASGISTKRAVEQAEAELAAVQGDYTAGRAALSAAGAGEGGAGRYTLAAPFAGTVVARNAVAGQTVSPDQPIVEVADLGTIWAILDVPDEKAVAVQQGQKVRLTVEGDQAELEGTITRLGAAVDPRTRTVRVRVDLPNPRRSLRAGLFVRAKIELAAPQGALLVPAEAVQTAEGRFLVFVRTAPGQYDPRPVLLGALDGGRVEIARGLIGGEEIVVAGAFLLKTEILKDSIGAGCVDD